MSHKNVIIEDDFQHIKEGLQSTWEDLWDKLHSAQNHEELLLLFLRN